MGGNRQRQGRKTSGAGSSDGKGAQLFHGIPTGINNPMVGK